MSSTTDTRDQLARVQHAARACAPLIHMAFDIASEAAVSDIECECPPVMRDGQRWYQTNPDRWVDELARSPYELKTLARAVDFCDHMKLLERHPAEPSLVRFPHVQG